MFLVYTFLLTNSHCGSEKGFVLHLWDRIIGVRFSNISKPCWLSIRALVLLSKLDHIGGAAAMGSRRVDWDSFRPSNGSYINRTLLEPSCTKGQYVWFSLLEFARGNFFSAAGFHQKKRENRN